MAPSSPKIPRPRRATTRALRLALATTLLVSACKRPTPVEEIDTHHRSSLADLPHWKQPTEDQVELLNSARAALLIGNTEEAFEQLGRLRATTNISLELRDGTLLYVEMLERRGREAEAIRVLDDFVMQIPPDGDAFFILGRMYQRAGDIAQAERALRDATRASPELLRAWIVLADLLDSTGRADEAKEIMVHYERQLFRLANAIERGATQEERVQAIHQLRVALPDPRISRVLAQALRNDALDVQNAALLALEKVGTANALPSLDAFIAATLNATLRDRAQEVRAIIQQRGYPPR